jgi:hypothetical protein
VRLLVLPEFEFQTKDMSPFSQNEGPVHETAAGPIYIDTPFCFSPLLSDTNWVAQYETFVHL